jgi:hypothetical protein
MVRLDSGVDITALTTGKKLEIPRTNFLRY